MFSVVSVKRLGDLNRIHLPGCHRRCPLALWTEAVEIYMRIARIADVLCVPKS
jgi:hypothetical protein